MRCEGGGNIGSGTVDEDDDFAGEVLAGKFIEIFLGDFEAVTDEDERGRETFFAGAAFAGEEHVVAGDKGERFSILD